MLGVLGGMGPLATVDFLKKLVQQTCSQTDQRHIPTVTWSVPQIPDRSRYIIHGAESPFPELRRGILQLQSMGANVVAIPCNTAHFWYQQLSEEFSIRILHIVDAVCDQLEALPIASQEKTVGVLCTSGTLKSEIYQHRLQAQGWRVIVPNSELQTNVMQGICLAKAGKIRQARITFLQNIASLKTQGANAIVLGCTEIPAVLDESVDLIDSHLALAKRCVKWFDAVYNGDPLTCN